MNKNAFIIAWITVMAAAFMTACEESDEEAKAREQRLLEQYLMEHNITQEPTASGLYYIPVIEGTGDQPGSETWVEFHYRGELLDGTLFDVSREDIARANDIFSENILYGPVRFQLNQLAITGLREGIGYMHAGETAEFIIPSKLAYGSSSSSLVPSYSTLIYTVELLTTFDDPHAHETALLEAYLQDNDITADSTETGLYYIEKSEGTGDSIQEGDQVSFWFTGYSLDGREFFSNSDGQVEIALLPDVSYPEGLNDGLLLMREGSEGTLIVPYYRAYGATGQIDIYGYVRVPPYTTVLFDIEIESVN